MTTIYSDYSELHAEFRRLGRLPTVKTRMALDAVLGEGFALTQQAVHVQTASLKTSGKKQSDTDKIRKRWEGEIRYGGPSLSINNPVDYAIYEQARDGAHDFMAPLATLHPLWVAAMKGVLRP